MGRKILVINGHPDPESFCQAIATTYYSAVQQASGEVEILNLRELKFNPNLQFGYRQRTELEPDLINAQNSIKNADHLVFVYPTWWGTYPALMKGFIDRVFLPGFAFKYHKDTVYWTKLLKGKTGHLIVTMDAPEWFYEEVFKLMWDSTQDFQERFHRKKRLKKKLKFWKKHSSL